MRWTRFGLLLLSFTIFAPQVRGQDEGDLPSLSETELLLERLQAAEARIAELESHAHSKDDSPKGEDSIVGYKDGFRIRSKNRDRNPFELAVNGRMQLRHTGFVRNETVWIDNAGVTHPITNRSDFEIERGRLEFHAIILDPRLHFYLNLDVDTDDNHRAVAHDFWINYKFSDALDLHVGKAFVPGSRDWLNGALHTRFADRSMSTTFFRPDRTIGVWALGEPVDDLFYRAMIGNGFNTADLEPDEIDNRFVYSGSIWRNFGDYGQGYSDLEWHDAPALQIGNSFTFSNASGRDTTGTSLAELNFVRLSDGTRLVKHGALAPGVTVDHFDIYLYAIDAAFKYRGFSVNSEYYFRWLESIRGNGALPINKMFDHGFYVEGGFFLIPKRIELNGRASPIFGEFGDAQEYACGVNWFINGTHNWKFTFDVAKLHQSPAENSGANYRAGDDGIMFRTQLQAAF